MVLRLQLEGDERTGRRTEIVLGSVVFEFNVETVLNTDLHLDGVVDLRKLLVVVHPDVLLLADVGCKGSRDGESQEIPLLQSISSCCSLVIEAWLLP